MVLQKQLIKGVLNGKLMYYDTAYFLCQTFVYRFCHPESVTSYLTYVINLQNLGGKYILSLTLLMIRMFRWGLAQLNIFTSVWTNND